MQVLAYSKHRKRGDGNHLRQVANPLSVQNEEQPVSHGNQEQIPAMSWPHANSALSVLCKTHFQEDPK